MWKAAFTELVATALIVFTLTRTIISCLDSHAVEPKLLVPLAVFIIAFLFLMVTIPLSGGHMSPAFTFIAALRGLVTLARAAINVCKELGIAMVFVVLAGSMALAVFVSITVTGRAGYVGVGLNPAGCLAPALLQGGRLWDGHWVFWVGWALFRLHCLLLFLFELTKGRGRV
uniref:Uncharacterized protein n=1 Tax=Quercus lobata TaxID=97700 RepID=A0A7N2MZV4_QUELO